MPLPPQPTLSWLPAYHPATLSYPGLTGVRSWPIGCRRPRLLSERRQLPPQPPGQRQKQQPSLAAQLAGTLLAGAARRCPLAASHRVAQADCAATTSLRLPPQQLPLSQQLHPTSRPFPAGSAPPPPLVAGRGWRRLPMALQLSCQQMCWLSCRPHWRRRRRAGRMGIESTDRKAQWHIEGWLHASVCVASAIQALRLATAPCPPGHYSRQWRLGWGCPPRHPPPRSCSPGNSWRWAALLAALPWLMKVAAPSLTKSECWPSCSSSRQRPTQKVRQPSKQRCTAALVARGQESRQGR